jgi:hypothetical protein
MSSAGLQGDNDWDGRSRAAGSGGSATRRNSSHISMPLIHCYRTRLTDEERRAYDEWEAGGCEASFRVRHEGALGSRPT